MRETLKVVKSTLPDFGSPVSGPEAVKLSAKLEEWRASDYAGFRRILEAGSDCARISRKSAPSPTPAAKASATS